MDKIEALSFLESHQPMPADTELSEELIARYDEVRRFFIQNPSEECIPLFLNSFGKGTGFGIYPIVDEVLWPFPQNVVVPYLRSAMQSSNADIRFWSSDIAMQYPDPSMIDVLGDLLLNDIDPGTRTNAANTLSFIENSAEIIREIFRRALTQESDEEVIEILKKTLSEPE